jgi:hypothetical protein
MTQECNCPVMDAADCLTLQLQLPRNYYRDQGIDAVCDCDCHGGQDGWDDDPEDETPFL